MSRTVRLATLGTTGSIIPTAALRRAAVRATWAPSVHNTQPWRFVIGHGVLEVHADVSRQLRVLDPTGRQLIISCGCAVLNARVSLAADGFAANVQQHAPSPDSDLLAELTKSSERDPSVAALDPLLSLRRTNRRQFAEDRVPEELLAVLAAAASVEGAGLFVVSEPAHRLATARLSRRAEAVEQSDPAYQAELRAWVTDDQQRGDGVPVDTLPRLRADGVDGLPLRNFGDPGDAGLPERASSSTHQTLLLLGTEDDDALAWLQAGEALERVWLEVTRAGYAMSLFTQLIEVPSTRELLRSELGLAMYPHVLLRVGRAPATPASRRRKLVEVLRHAPGVEGV